MFALDYLNLHSIEIFFLTDTLLKSLHDNKVLSLLGEIDVIYRKDRENA